ncbi:MAG: response regulator [bacterium]|nr:response regulator [bacterium]
MTASLLEHYGGAFMAMGESANILIIDDDEDYRASTRALLEGEGYTVREAPNGRDGLAAVREDRPDLIVCDVMMDSIGEGYSVTQALRQLPEFRELVPVPILMASSVEADPASLFGWMGDTSPITPDMYMTKPLNIPEFLGNVRKLLNH